MARTRSSPHGGLDGVDRIFGIHCDPAVDVGHVGLAEGPITAAADSVTVTLSGRGGHTSRPHLTEDLTYALAKVVTDVPAALSRRLDPRAGAALVWGSLHAGGAAERHPVDRHGQRDAADARRRRLGHDGAPGGGPGEAVVAPYGVSAKVEHVRGVPPVVNDHVAVRGRLRRARAVARPGRRRVDPAVARRRGLRLVPRDRARRDGPARHPHARGAAPTTCTRAT